MPQASPTVSKPVAPPENAKLAAAIARFLEQHPKVEPVSSASVTRSSDWGTTSNGRSASSARSSASFPALPLASTTRRA